MVTKSSASPQSMLVMMRFTPFSDSGSPWKMTQWLMVSVKQNSSYRAQRLVCVQLCCLLGVGEVDAHSQHLVEIPWCASSARLTWNTPCPIAACTHTLTRLPSSASAVAMSRTISSSVPTL